MTDPGPAMGTIRTAIVGRGVINGEQGIEFHRPSLLDRTDHLNSAIEHIEQAYAELRSRLEPVVIPSVPSPPTPEGRLASVNNADPSWIAEYFDDVTARVHQLAGSIAAFTARVDL